MTGMMPAVQTLLNFFNAATGSDINENELLIVGERIVNTERAFNIREGLTRKDDTLPERFLKEPLPEGSAKGQVVELEPMIDRYYEVRGWDKKTGLQRKTKLMQLGLEDIAVELESLGKTSRS
jgi:aldehyde:ferredoxin oxidoreductase